MARRAICLEICRMSENTAKRDIVDLKNRDLIEVSGSFKTGAYKLAR